MEELNKKLNSIFPGKVVRKDLTKKIKEGANVPVYVLEYLLGMYCATDDESAIDDGIETVKKILADNFVRPDEAEKVKSKIRENGSYTVIDKITVKLNDKMDRYEAEFSNLGIKDASINEKFVKDYEKLLIGGIWCIVSVSYYHDDQDRHALPFTIIQLTPIQMPNLDLNDIKQGRTNFNKEEWIDVLIRSMGIEPSKLKEEQKWHFIERAVPLVENNYNLCELGPRGTGKSHIYKEISPNSILVSGGQTTVANLFYNMSQKKIGLVGMWDCVAFDEVAGINFKDKDGIQIMKDYMASGSFARGKEEKNANASMVFVGNINQSVEVILKTSHLFEPFPPEMANDTAFFDRMHYYLPGWEIPKMRPELITDDYGFITDYLSSYFREMRKETYSDALDKYFRLGDNLNQRDVIAVRKTVSGLVKLIYPNGEYTKEQLEEILVYSLIGRRRVKEQLKKIGGMEFYDVHFSYIDKETMEEKFVSVPESGGGKLIPEGQLKAGHTYFIGRGSSGMIGTYKLEVESPKGHGKYNITGIGSDREAKEALNTAYNYFKANKKNISQTINTEDYDYLLHVEDLQGVGSSKDISLAAYVAMCSSALNKPMQGSLVILGSLSIGGTISKVDELSNTFFHLFLNNL
jgi:ATP-dependent Lon protease